MRAVMFTEKARREVLQAASDTGLSSDFAAGCLDAVAIDIARTFDDLVLRPPGYPNRRTSLTVAEALGVVEVVVEERSTGLWILAVRIEAFGQ